MSDVNTLMADSLAQLEEHKVWLKEQMSTWLHAQPGGEWKISFRVLIAQVDDIKLRMSRAEGDATVSTLWEYPDELMVWLRSQAPDHIRKSLEGGRLVDMNQPGHSAKRVP